jgi:hypothetical protein
LSSHVFVTFLFLEHGLSRESNIQNWQRRLNWLEMRFADGCHLDRNMKELVAAQRFLSVEIEEFYLEMTPKTHGHLYQGIAVKWRAAERMEEQLFGINALPRRPSGPYNLRHEDRDPICWNWSGHLAPHPSPRRKAASGRGPRHSPALFPQGEKDYMHELSAKAQAGTLTPDEEEKMDAYERAGALLSILKSKTRQTLKKTASASWSMPYGRLAEKSIRLAETYCRFARSLAIRTNVSLSQSGKIWSLSRV